MRKIQGEFEKINLEKSDIIKNLQDRLDLSQRKVEQIQSQNSSVSQKLMKRSISSKDSDKYILTFQRISEKSKSDVWKV